MRESQPTGKRLVLDAFESERVKPTEYDALLAQGWRHFGREWYRYNFSVLDGHLQEIVALRVEIGNFRPSASQRRILRRNADLRVAIRPVVVDNENRALFARHCERFRENIPDALESMLGSDQYQRPAELLELQVRCGDALVAASWIGIGRHASSAVYAVHEPTLARRSLGIFTLLKELEFAAIRGFRWHYLGYGTRGPSCYTYKLQFSGTQEYDWQGQWHARSRVPAGGAPRQRPGAHEEDRGR